MLWLFFDQKSYDSSTLSNITAQRSQKGPIAQPNSEESSPHSSPKSYAPKSYGIDSPIVILVVEFQREGCQIR